MAKGYDVVVIGGGPGGVSAALAAARGGAKVCLVEKYGFLGGMATVGLVNPWMLSGNGHPGEIVAGIYAEVRQALAKRAQEHGYKEFHAGRAFDEEDLKVILDELVTAARVDVWFHTTLVDAKVSRGRIRAVRVVNKSGLLTIAGTIFIDATGDGDLSVRAGALCEQGRPGDGRVQPMTLCFRLAGVDLERMPPQKEINALWRQERAKHDLLNPRGDVLWFRTVHPGVVHFNTTRVAGNPVDGQALSEAEMQGRKQVQEMVRFLISRIRGFEKAYLDHSGPQIGARESRRVIGDYVLTTEDVLEARKFKDGIVRGAYEIDIHSPTDGSTDHRSLRPLTSYEIPYRCLVPKGLLNLLVASRCISATHEAHASLRIMPIVYGIGQAAGTAAAMCLAGQTTPRRLSAKALRVKLVQQGAELQREEGSSEPV